MLEHQIGKCHSCCTDCSCMCFAPYRLMGTCSSFTGPTHLSQLWTTSRMEIMMSSNLRGRISASISFSCFLTVSLSILLSWLIQYTGLAGFWWLRWKYKTKNPKIQFPLHKLLLQQEGDCRRYNSAFFPLENQKVILFYKALEVFWKEGCYLVTEVWMVLSHEYLWISLWANIIQ